MRFGSLGFGFSCMLHVLSVKRHMGVFFFGVLGKMFGCLTLM